MTIRRGEFVALLGPSGCGKTTALNCLAGLLTLTDGSIWLDERRIDPLRPEERGFGMVFQNYALFPHLDVRKNIGFGLVMRRLPRAEIELARRPRRSSSCSSRRTRTSCRASFPAGSSSASPSRAPSSSSRRSILMDEPLSNLDAKLRLEMRAEIRSIHRQLGRATVYVTHDQEEALSLADRVVVMKDGLVRAGRHARGALPPAGRSRRRQLHGFPERARPAKRCGAAGGQATVPRTGSTTLNGIARGAVGARARRRVPAGGHRPGDGAGNAIPVEVTSVDYGGREFLLKAQTADGLVIHARSEHRVAVGERVSLTIAPDRVLVFAADAAPCARRRSSHGARTADLAAPAPSSPSRVTLDSTLVLVAPAVLFVLRCSSSRSSTGWSCRSRR